MKRWLRTGLSVAVASVAILLFVGPAGGDSRSASQMLFDLAVRDMNVKQSSSTPMFRTVEISCTVESRGPRASNATAWVLISRPGDAAPQILKMVAIPRPMEAGDKFQARLQTYAWAATSVPYRCEIEFSGTYASGDADPSNDFAEFTFPKL